MTLDIARWLADYTRRVEPMTPAHLGSPEHDVPLYPPVLDAIAALVADTPPGAHPCSA